MNRHLKVAILMAPLLAIGAYVITGYFVSSKQVKDSNGRLYIAGQCLPTENSCTFTSPNVDLRVVSNEQKGQQQLALLSTESINNLTVALGVNDQFKQFEIMKSDNNRYWQIKLQANDQIKDFTQIRIAFIMNENSYFAESEVLL